MTGLLVILEIDPPYLVTLDVGHVGLQASSIAAQSMQLRGVTLSDFRGGWIMLLSYADEGTS